MLFSKAKAHFSLVSATAEENTWVEARRELMDFSSGDEDGECLPISGWLMGIDGVFTNSQPYRINP